MVILVFWLFMIRPQKKQEQKDSAMRDALAVGDEVTTIGGIIGKVVSIKGETFVLETTRDKTKIRFLKAAVRSIDVKAADIAKKVPHARDVDDAMADARRTFDWEKQWEYSIDPETAKAIRDSRAPEHEDSCSMCGKFCAVRSMNKALNGEYIDIL